MPYYIFKCSQCGHGFEESMAYEEMLNVLASGSCSECGGTWRRNYNKENAKSTFHMTTDLYANDLKRRAVKNAKMDRAP